MWQISVTMTEMKISKISGGWNKQRKIFLKDKKRGQIQNKNIFKIENRYRTIEVNPWKYVRLFDLNYWAKR